MLITVIFAILFFSLIIFIHELGHYLTARMFKVKIHEFAIGMGPKLFSKEKGGILYSLRLVPIGGFCAMEGEDGGSSESEGALCRKPWYQKLIILAAGAFMNILLGFFIVLIFLCISVSFSKAIAVPKVAETVESSDAANYLKEGDRIIKVGSERVHIVRDVNFAMQQNGSKPIEITVKRDGKKMSFTIKPHKVSYEGGGEGYIIGFTTAAEPANPFNVMKEAFFDTVWMGKTVFISLKMLISGEVGMKEMSGPVGVVSAMNTAAEESGGGLIGFLNLLYLAAFISVNIGIMNLLPLPALDGGRIFFTLIEAIRRKPIPAEKEGFVHMIGFMLLLCLMVFATWNDIMKLITK